jgi:hypothetical protein
VKPAREKCPYGSGVPGLYKRADDWSGTGAEILPAGKLQKMTANSPAPVTRCEVERDDGGILICIKPDAAHWNAPA